MTDENPDIDGLEEVAETPQPEADQQDQQQSDELVQLKLQLEQAQAEARAANERAARYENEQTQRHTELTEQVNARFAAEEHAVASTLSAAELALKTAKDAFVAAQTEGRFADAADLAEQISDAKMALNGAKYRKQQIDAAKANATKQLAERSTQVSADPEEQLLSQVSRTSANWLRGKPEILSKMVTDSRFNARVVSLHNAAIADGIDIDTPEYFKFVEEGLAPPAAAAAAPKSKSGMTSAAAPGARKAATGGATSAGRTVHIDDVVRKMTPDMRAAAKTSFGNSMSEDEALKAYARGIIAEKQRDPSFLPDFKI